MRLHELYVKNYKQLSKFSIRFENVQKSVGKDPFRFLVGRNGVGKTSLLEAIGLIFTRIMQDETPGFYFKLVYSMETDGKSVIIEVEPNSRLDAAQQQNSQDIVNSDTESRLQVYVTDSTGSRYRLDLRRRPFSEWKEYHPRRVIGFASGPTNIFEDVLLHSPAESLKSDIYDARYREQEEQDYDLQTLDIEHSLVNLKRLYDDASYLYIDGKTAKFVLICLSATIPIVYSETGEQLDREYIQLRYSLFNMIGGLKPVGVTLVIDEDKLRNYIQTDQAPPRLQMLIKWMSTQAELENEQEVYYAWNISRDKTTVKQYAERVTRERVAYFPIVHDESNEFRCHGLTADCNPFDMLTLLLIASREGFLLDAHLIFQHKQSKQLFNESALSDGEYLWISRLGLVLLSRANENGDLLFLFDEPDVHLNESWNEKFVEMLHQLSHSSKGMTKDEFIIATHSTLLLTDADPDQVYLLEKGKETPTQVEKLAISTFAANRAEISKRIFGVDSPIGQYSLRLLKERFETNSKEDLFDLLNKVGPGYYRFRVHSQLERLEHPEENEEGGQEDITPDEKD